MEEKNLPVPARHTPQTQVEADYQQARAYFKDSALQMLKTNAALLTVTGLFLIRGLRCIWEMLRQYFPWDK